MNIHAPQDERARDRRPFPSPQPLPEKGGSYFTISRWSTPLPRSRFFAFLLSSLILSRRSFTESAPVRTRLSEVEPGEWAVLDVKEHGGAIDVVSAVGQGTTFTVWLPRIVASGDSPATEKPDLSGHGQVILAVDDEPEVLAALEEMLATLGYEPAGYNDSREALEAFRADPLPLRGNGGNNPPRLRSARRPREAG